MVDQGRRHGWDERVRSEGREQLTTRVAWGGMDGTSVCERSEGREQLTHDDEVEDEKEID